MEEQTVTNQFQQPNTQSQVTQEPKRHSFLTSKLFLITLAILVLFTAVYAGIYLYLGSQLDQISKSNQTAITPQLSLAPDPTANWKTYRNEEYGFETKYHPESSPNENVGNETSGQFTYLLLIRFGTNPIKFPHGYEFRINRQSLDDYRSELIGHTTDKIDSEEEILVNGNTWTKINYEVFVTTDYAPITTAITNHAGYSYAITSSSLDIDQILSTFKFTDQEDQVVCTQDAKLCPDGSYVSRQSPTCEFAPCP